MLRVSMKARKGDLWVSAVLYLILGVIAIALILGAAIPLVNKLKDRKTVAQAKEVLFTLDEILRRVANEGPGSQRELSLFTINAGKLIIDQDAEVIRWELETEAVIQEPNIDIKEGVLTLRLDETKTEGKYLMSITTKYDGIDLNLKSPFNNPFIGEFSVLVQHAGRFPANKPEIVVNIK